MTNTPTPDPEKIAREQIVLSITETHNWPLQEGEKPKGWEVNL